MLRIILMIFFYSGVPVNYDNGPNAQYQDNETYPAKWNAAVLNVIVYTCAFSTAISRFPAIKIDTCSLTVNRYVSDVLPGVFCLGWPEWRHK